MHARGKPKMDSNEGIGAEGSGFGWFVPQTPRNATCPTHTTARLRLFSRMIRLSGQISGPAGIIKGSQGWHCLYGFSLRRTLQRRNDLPAAARLMRTVDSLTPGKSNRVEIPAMPGVLFDKGVQFTKSVEV